MRTGTFVALPIALVVFTTHEASLAPRALPKAELIQDVNKVGESGFCRFDYTFGSDSCPEQFTPLATDVAFLALDPNGFALWRTDGTRAGTTLIRDVNSIRIYNPIVAGNGVMFFVAQDRSGQFGTELWRSDGTFNGTVMVADLNPGPASSQGPSPQMLNAGGVLYFLATDGVSGGELWKIEAGRSVPGTGLLPRPQLVKDIYPGPGPGGAGPLAFAGSTLFFGAQDPEHGVELWKTDGTTEGTVLVKDILPGPESSTPFQIVPFGDRVLFTTYLYDDQARSGLWISDGRGCWPAFAHGPSRANVSVKRSSCRDAPQSRAGTRRTTKEKTMPRISDYMAHSGSAKILTTGDIDVDFVFGGMGTGGVGSGCVATFMVNTETSNDLKVQCKLGGQAGPVIWSYGPTDTNLTRPFQQIFNGLTVAGPNTLHFRIVGGTGAMSITNLVVWFQRDI